MPIVTVIIVEMLWDPKDIKCHTHVNIMGCFIYCVDYSEDLQVVQGRYRYCVTIKNLLQLSLKIDHLLVGLNFRQAACLFHSTKDHIGISTTRLSSDNMITK